jgi:hypothetical protein
MRAGIAYATHIAACSQQNPRWIGEEHIDSSVTLREDLVVHACERGTSSGDCCGEGSAGVSAEARVDSCIREEMDNSKRCTQ